MGRRRWRGCIGRAVTSLALGSTFACGASDRADAGSPATGSEGGSSAASDSGAGGEQTSEGGAGAGDGGSVARSPSGSGGFDSGGASGMGGAGQAGQGGSAVIDPGPCGFGAPFSCEDGNSCTVDSIDDECACHHEPAEDGTSCSDGDVCTLNDHCEAGRCTAERYVSAPAVIGTLDSFGANPGLRTLVALPSERRAVFATNGELALVGMDGERLTILDRSEMGAPLDSDFVSSMIPVLRPRTFVVPLTPERIAVVARNWGIDLYDLDGDRITPSERFGFLDTDLRAAAGAGARIFTCVVSTVHSYAIDPATSAISAGPTLQLPGGKTCHGLALGSDGTTLWAATSGGLQRLDVSNPDGSILFQSTSLASSYLIDVSLSDSFVAVLEVRETFSGVSDVVVLSTDTLGEVARFTAVLGDDGRVPIGFRLMGDDRLLLQWSQEADDCVVQTVEVHALGTTGATLLDEWTSLDACSNPVARPTFNTTASATHAAIEPVHQLVRVDASTGAITPLSGLAQGSFERVRGAGSTAIEVYGPASTQLVDIATPDAPALVQGGLVSPMTLDWLRLVLPNAAEPLIATTRSLQPNVTGRRMTLLSSNGRDLPAVIGSIQNENSKGEWAAAARSLFHVTAAGEMEFRIQRFPTASLDEGGDQTLVADLDQVVTAPAPEELDRSRFAFSVDPRTGDLGLAESRTDGGANFVTRFSWFSLGPTGYERAFSSDPVGLPFLDVSLHASTAVVVYGDQLVQMTAGGRLDSFDFAEADFSPAVLLDYTEKLVYLGGVFLSEPRSNGVLVLLANGLEEVARYYTAEPISSSAEVGSHVAFGSPASLAIATPWCPDE